MAKITREKMKGCVKSSALTIATLCGVIGGIVLGITLKNARGKLTKTIELLMFNARKFRVIQSTGTIEKLRQ